jgi:uncharacterized lipoprotein
MCLNIKIKWFKIIALGLSILILGGCGQKGWIRDRSKDYISAESYEIIEVPAEMHPAPFSPEYQIPGDRDACKLNENG